ncbi:MAG: hypothetical protein LC742_11785 [Acidobacteria bacterium]|nr:hypothetical protein [Acidobacteriota bacterium]
MTRALFAARCFLIASLRASSVVVGLWTAAMGSTLTPGRRIASAKWSVMSLTVSPGRESHVRAAGKCVPQ